MWTSAVMPRVSISRAAASASARLVRALTTMDAPPAASASAMARPILRPAPVTSATFPLSSLLAIAVPPYPRHGRPCAGYPRLLFAADVDGRDEPSHDDKLVS